MIVTEKQGNILEATELVIAHGVNCQGVMGSGAAKALYEKWPIVKEKYLKLCDAQLQVVGPEMLLGYTQYINVDDLRVVINCFTQENYGYDEKLYLSYDAIATCFIWIESFNLKEIAIPKIGCGLAGGNWEEVKEIINAKTPMTNVHVYLGI